MPEMAEFIAALRAAFGDEVIDDAVRRGKAGEPTLFAHENGRSIGTASPSAHSIWRVDETLLDGHYCAGCDGAALTYLTEVRTFVRCPSRGESCEQVKGTIDFLRLALSKLTKLWSETINLVRMVLRHTLAVGCAQLCRREGVVQLEYSARFLDWVNL